MNSKAFTLHSKTITLNVENGELHGSEFNGLSLDLSNIKDMYNCTFQSCDIHNSGEVIPVGCKFIDCNLPHGFGYEYYSHFIKDNTVQSCITHCEKWDLLKDPGLTKSEEPISYNEFCTNATVAFYVNELAKKAATGDHKKSPTELTNKYLGEIVSLYDDQTILFVTENNPLMTEPDYVVQEQGDNPVLKQAFKWLGKSYFWNGKYGVITKYHTDNEGDSIPEIFIQYLDSSFDFIELTKKNIKKLKKSVLHSMTWVSTQELLS